MGRARVVLAIVVLGAASIAFAQQPSKPAEKPNPKNEQAATAAGGQSAGAGPTTASAGFELRAETFAMTLGAILAGVVAANVQNNSTTSH